MLTQEDILRRHPTVYRKSEWNFKAGWHELLDRAGFAIARVINKLPEEDRHLYGIGGGKEKYAALQMHFIHPQAGYKSTRAFPASPPDPGYHQGVVHEILELLNRVGYLSAQICEECGAPGMFRVVDDWERTLCDAHYTPPEREPLEAVNFDDEFGQIPENIAPVDNRPGFEEGLFEDWLLGTGLKVRSTNYLTLAWWGAVAHNGGFKGDIESFLQTWVDKGLLEQKWEDLDAEEDAIVDCDFPGASPFWRGTSKLTALLSKGTRDG